MHYYQFNIGDYIRETAHLTVEEDCIYRRLLDHYYETESPIPKITQPVIRRLRLGSFSDTFSAVLAEFFILSDDDCWHHARCDREIVRYRANSEQARVNGSKGGRPKKPKITQPVNLANPDVTQPKANQEPITNNHKPKKEKESEKKFSDEDKVFVEYMFSKIRDINPKAKIPNFDKWANTIRLIRDRDNRTKHEIQSVFEWANNNDFWQANILSPEKLRAQFDTLIMQQQRGGNNGQKESCGNRVRSNLKRLFDEA